MGTMKGRVPGVPVILLQPNYKVRIQLWWRCALCSYYFPPHQYRAVWKQQQDMGLPPRKIFSFLRTIKNDVTVKTADVYRIPCECGKVYIGQTGSLIKSRLNDHHRHIRLHHPEKSAVAEHGINWGLRTGIHRCSAEDDNMYGPDLKGRDGPLRVSFVTGEDLDISMLKCQLRPMGSERAHYTYSTLPATPSPIHRSSGVYLKSPDWAGSVSASRIQIDPFPSDSHLLQPHMYGPSEYRLITPRLSLKRQPNRRNEIVLWLFSYPDWGFPCFFSVVRHITGCNS
jgi:hypothetical protein